MLLGIDPGQKGGIAWASESGYGAIQMPKTTQQVYKALLGFIGGVSGCKCCIEQVQVMGKMFGAKAALSYGQGYGEIIGILTALSVEIHEVRPSVWKRKLNISADKNDSILLCERLYPELNLIPVQCRKPQDGIAEAILILHYGRKHLWAKFI